MNKVTEKLFDMNDRPEDPQYKASRLTHWIGVICKYLPRGKGAVARGLGRLLNPFFTDRYITTRYGAQMVINSRNLDFYATMTRWNGSWEHWVFDTAHWLLPEQGTFYDIGANVGYMSMEMLQRRPESTLVCFEPIPELAELIRKSIKLNEFGSRAQLLEYGLSDTAQEAASLSVPKHQAHSTLEPEFQQAGAEHFSIELQRLDDLVLQHQLPLPDLIKIDVEGHEIPALTGAIKTLSASQPHVLFEANNIKQLNELKSLLSGVTDYRYFYAIGSYRPLKELPKEVEIIDKIDVIAINTTRAGLPDDVLHQL